MYRALLPLIPWYFATKLVHLAYHGPGTPDRFNLGLKSDCRHVISKYSTRILHAGPYEIRKETDTRVLTATNLRNSRAITDATAHCVSDRLLARSKSMTAIMFSGKVDVCNRASALCSKRFALESFAKCTQSIKDGWGEFV
jgi:hypothetical protein